VKKELQGGKRIDKDCPFLQNRLLLGTIIYIATNETVDCVAFQTEELASRVQLYYKLYLTTTGLVDIRTINKEGDKDLV